MPFRSSERILYHMYNTVTGQKTRQKAPGQKSPGQKPPRIIEDIITKYAVDANLFRLGSTLKKKIQSLLFFFFAFIMGAYCRGGAFDLEPYNTYCCELTVVGIYELNNLCLRIFL